MELQLFSKINRERCTSPGGFNHTLDTWSYAEWTNAIAGEVGEACNLTKKLTRHRDKIPGNIKKVDQSVDILKLRAAQELADAFIYIDLAIQALGFNTSKIVRDKFNDKSRQLNCKIVVW